MIAPLAKLLDWLAIQLVWGRRARSLLKLGANPRLEEAIQYLERQWGYLERQWGQNHTVYISAIPVRERQWGQNHTVYISAIPTSVFSGVFLPLLAQPSPHVCHIPKRWPSRQTRGGASPRSANHWRRNTRSPASFSRWVTAFIRHSNRGDAKGIGTPSTSRTTTSFAASA
jgi:hypothetical protein